MPELPEVQTVVDTLRPRVVGKVVRGVTLYRPDFATPIGFDWPAALLGRTVRDLRRRAKRIVFTLDDGRHCYAHLGMTGRITFCEGREPHAPHTHVVLAFDHGEMRLSDPRRFGGWHWLGNDLDEDRIGPEPLTLRAPVLAERLLLTWRPVKAALLDQAFVAGIGNIYADEALHAAGIHPLTPCRDLDRPAAARLCRAIKAVLNKAIRHRGSTLRDYRDAAGQAGGFQKLHRVYDRAGRPCRGCHAPIERIVLGGRSAHFCPSCQPPVSRDVLGPAGGAPAHGAAGTQRTIQSKLRRAAASA